MSVTLFGMVTLVSLAQLENVSDRMAFSAAGSLISVRAEQSLKAPLPMLVTLFGIVTLVRLVQPLNELASMLVTLFGMVTLVRLVQPENAPP